MKQAVQSISGGSVRVIDVPRPTIGPTEVLVQTLLSVISPGTERAVTTLAQSSLIAKARARPDLVRQVLQKARRDGIPQTLRTVRARLDDDMPLGYSAAGIAIEVGGAVSGVTPGQHVATGGAGKANHAEYQAVPGLLCANIPDKVTTEEAAFSTIASIALHGLRLAELGPGSRVVVIGLGLVGQLTMRLAKASGYLVAGIDMASFPIEVARGSGGEAFVESGEETTEEILRWSRGRGADAVIVTASSSSSAAMTRSPALCRDRATVVVVGDVGLNLSRTPLYEKELSLRFARSYGPGRYERTYEEWGVDYPAGYVRWTEGRNLEAVLSLLAGGHLQVSDLVTHRFPIDRATEAYELIEKRAEPFLGVQLTYPEGTTPESPIRIKPSTTKSGELGVGLIGAGAFAKTVLLPAFQTAGFKRLVSVASASGLSARHLADRVGFEKAVSGADALIADPEVDVVIIATPHESHARIAAQALRAGKHVFCEKPLALSEAELDEVEAAWRDSGRVLFVGFNRRYSKAVSLVRDHFSRGSDPITIVYRVNAGRLPNDHWYGDRREGGRLLGEVCHFVDTCSALLDSEPTAVRALASGHSERLLSDHLILGLSFPGGSQAAIIYEPAGHPKVAKESVEIHGRDRSATVNDFRTLSLDGRKDKAVPGKGHLEEVVEFRRLLDSPSPAGTLTMLATHRATLSAAADLLSDSS